MNRWISIVLTAAVLSSGKAYGFDEINVKDPLASGAMTSPIAVAVGVDRIFVLDSVKNSLFIFDASGKFLSEAGKKGSGPDQFLGPSSVAVGRNGKVYVADSGNSRIRVLDKDGAPRASFGSKGKEPGQLRNPMGVAVGPGGRVYVSDTGNARVQVFTGDGIFLNVFGAGVPAAFKEPMDIQADPSGQLHVLDLGEKVIQHFSPDGQKLSGTPVTGAAFAVDAFGTFYVVQPSESKILEMPAPGGSQPFGMKGSKLGQFKKPSGVAVDGEGIVYVADTGNKRIQRIAVFNRKRGPRLSIQPSPGLLITPADSFDAKAAALLPLDDGKFYAFLSEKSQYALLGPKGEEDTVFGPAPKQPGFTKTVGGLAYVSGTGLFASQPDLNQVVLFSSTGGVVMNYGQKGGMFEKKSKEGNLSLPMGLAATDKGTVYVSDTGNARIQAFSSQGVFLKTLGPKLDGFDLLEPVAVAWDSDGYLYIADRKAKKIAKCETSGKFVEAWGAGLQAPSAIAMDGRGYLYVLDAGPRIHVFNTKGNPLGSFFAAGPGLTELTAPAAIAFRDGKIWVSDPGKAKVLAFKVEPILAPPAGIEVSATAGEAKLKWEASEDGWMRQYHIARSTASDGEYVEAGTSQAAEFKDKDLPEYNTYYYRLTTEAKTGSVGPPSPALQVYVPGSFNRPPIEIAKIDIGNIFSANYKYYLKNPVGSLKIINNEDMAFKNAKISFALKDFMDYPYDIPLKTIEPKASIDIPLQATLNNRILDVSEDTPIQALFTLTYYEEGKETKISLAKPLKVYSKNAIRWDNPERLANFVTPKDPPVFDFSHQILSMNLGEGMPFIRTVRDAIVLWSAVGALGAQYAPDPKNPYEKMSEDANLPEDTVQHPRETLKIRTGDCDDLVAFFATLFEGASIRTAFLDYPGHITFMFDTGASDPVGLGIPAEKLVLYEGTYWIPLEVTMAGKPFAESVRSAVGLHRQMADKGKVKVYDVHKAWGTFEPMTLQATAWNAELPKTDEIRRRFEADASALAKDRYSFLKAYYGGILKANPADPEALNESGLLESEAGKPPEARKQFEALLKVEPNNASALNNLGSLSYQEGDLLSAEKYYAQASAADPADTGILMNRARAAIGLKKGAEAKGFLSEAVAEDKAFEQEAEPLMKEAEALAEQQPAEVSPAPSSPAEVKPVEKMEGAPAQTVPTEPKPSGKAEEVKPAEKTEAPPDKVDKP